MYCRGLRFLIFFSCMLSLFSISRAYDKVPWVYGSVQDISYIKNSSDEVETVYSLKLRSYSGISYSKISNYLQFKVYARGGIWDGINYRENSFNLKKTLEDKVFVLKKVYGKFYLTEVVIKKSELDKSLQAQASFEVLRSNQFGPLLGKHKRAPAQVDNNKNAENFSLDEIGSLAFALIVLAFGSLIYVTSHRG